MVEELVMLEILECIAEGEGSLGVGDDDDPESKEKNKKVRVRRLEGSEILAEGGLHSFALQTLGGARMDAGNNAGGEENGNHVPIKIIDEQNHGLLMLGMQSFTLLKDSVDAGRTVLLPIRPDRNEYGKSGNYIFTMQHNIGQIHHRGHDLHCERTLGNSLSPYPSAGFRRHQI